MCNLYSITANQAAIVALFRVVNRYVGNLPPMPGVFPDYPAPVIRNTNHGTELTTMRWGMPPPPKFGGAPVTNIRNTSSPHWRGWLKPETRCLVPFNSFAEYAPEPNPETKKKDVVWFALNDDRTMTAFAGIWTEFKGDRGTKSKPVPGPHLVYGFLTTSPNTVVEPIHPNASNLYEAKLFRTVNATRRALLCPVLWVSPKGSVQIMQAAEPLTEMMSYEEYEEAFEAWDYMPGEDGCPLRTEGMRLGLFERPKSCARLRPSQILRIGSWRRKQDRIPSNAA
jgi:putative SOS response-associated peptidase YedK